MKTTRKKLQTQVDSINRSEVKKDYQLEFSAAGWRLVKNNGSENISPLLDATEMQIYLDAFYTAVVREGDKLYRLM